MRSASAVKSINVVSGVKILANNLGKSIIPAHIANEKLKQVINNSLNPAPDPALEAWQTA